MGSTHPRFFQRYTGKRGGVNREEYDFMKHFVRVEINAARVRRLGIANGTMVGREFTHSLLNSAIRATQKCLAWEPEQKDMFS